MNRAFFFDRDGIVNRLLDNDYVKRIDEFEFLPEFFEIFKYVISKGYLTIVITNQQGIGKGKMTDADLEIIHKWMQSEIKERTGYQFDDIFYCGALHSENSLRRKPNPGMIYEAIEKWNINPNLSFMIGDSERDAQTIEAVGGKSILIGYYPDLNANFKFDTLGDFLKGIREIV